MKKVFIALIAIGISACSTPKDITKEGGYSYYGIDFRKYTDKEFLITPESPIGDYESIGLIEVNLQPEVKEINVVEYNRMNREENPTFIAQKGSRDGETTEYYAIEILDVQKVIDEIYRIGTEWGADSIYNLEIESTVITDIISIETFKVSGFAVKRN